MNFPKYPVILMPEAKNQQDLDVTRDPEDLGPYWTESFSHVFYWVFPLCVEGPSPDLRDLND